MAPDTDEYEAGLTVIGEFETVETFCRYFNWLKPPSKLERNSNYHLFKSGIKPMWEDEANANGGKWVLTMKQNPQLLDRCWMWLAMALIGEDLDDGDEICGAVVSLRSKVDRIQLWTRSKEDVERINGIGKKLVKLLDVSEADGIGLEFQVSRTPVPNLPHVMFDTCLYSITTTTDLCLTSSSPSKLYHRHRIVRRSPANMGEPPLQTGQPQHQFLEVPLAALGWVESVQDGAVNGKQCHMDIPFQCGWFRFPYLSFQFRSGYFVPGCVPVHSLMEMI